jgi:hypothetical protein
MTPNMMMNPIRFFRRVGSNENRLPADRAHTSTERRLPAIVPGAVWLVGAGDGDPRHLSPLGAYALSIADAVIHDLGIDTRILALAEPPRYREAAEPQRAVKRVAKLAEDGWRVVHLVEGNAMERAIEAAKSVIDRHIPYRIVPSCSEPGTEETLFQACPVPRPGDDEPQTTLVLLVPAPQEEATTSDKTPFPLTDFSMTGLAG